MSTRSTNLDLELQAAGERASLNILNSNLGKIDEFAGEVFIEFGTSSKTIDQNLTDYWTTYIPNDGKPHLVKINAMYGVCVGFLSRYSDLYGSGCLTRYEGTMYRVALSNGTVWNGPVALKSEIELVAPTYNNGSYGTQNFFVRAVGRVVTLNGYFTFTNAPTGEVTIGNIADHRPIAPVRTMCAISDAAYNEPKTFGYFTVSDNGNVTIKAPSNNTYKVIYVSCSWIYQGTL